MKKVISVSSNLKKQINIAKNNEGDTTFHQLAKNTQGILTQIFTKNPRSIKELTKVKNKEGETIFHTLANHLHFNELLELIKLDSSLINKLKNIKDNEGNTVFDMLNKTKPGQKTLAKLVTQIPPGSIKELGKIEVKMTPFTSNNGENFTDTVLHALAKKQPTQLIEEIKAQTPEKKLKIVTELSKIKNKDGDTVLHALAKIQPHELTDLIADLIDKLGTKKVQNIIDIENKEGKNVLNILVEKNTSITDLRG